MPPPSQPPPSPPNAPSAPSWQSPSSSPSPSTQRTSTAPTYRATDSQSPSTSGCPPKPASRPPQCGPSTAQCTASSAFDTIYLVPLHGAISTYVDDTLNAGDTAFLSSVTAILSRYSTHRPDHDTIQFADISARTDADGIQCDAGFYTSSIDPLPLPLPLSSPFDNPKLLHSLAAKLLWVGRVARPDVLTNATQLSNMPDPTGADARRANDTLATLTRMPVTLHYPKIDVASLQVSVFADYSGSATSPFPKRQVGYLSALFDDSHRFSLLHWASHRPHRVCRGSCAGELLALAAAVASALDIRLLLQELLSRRVPMAPYTDSSAAYDVITSFKDQSGVLV